ncbi:MAG: hypothetical protein A2527_02955 [Candidatus Lambdaproteobacteria bacterium RIFOXYD2_FULL_50_16]|uniref:PASTA domain-containing protein n=1 Tax=Candidatus Lambdaproteobacteria bacterium RIFOXYD2_FULL_50_16 TaxID=1817772 RepID=A0A1F6GG08_9PROT|nr:MAG: hypothetical protein A2527_02955 [Candidatus Lambdaproteobacteria bacterium RIFOXYD2_FULL_50_16]
MGLSEQLAGQSFYQRLKWVRLLFFIALAGVTGRAFYLQVFLKSDLDKRAAMQYRQSEDLRLQRGPIVDRAGEMLAVSLPMTSLFVVPAEVEKPAEAARQLAPLLGIDQEQLLKKMTEPGPFAWLKRRLHPRLAEAVSRLKIPGVHELGEYQRFYPRQTHSAHLLGIVGIDSKGLEGLELRYNDHLMDGTDRQATWASFSSGEPVGRLSGGSIELTIDNRIQYFVEEELNKGVQGLGAKNGVAILMETETGRILAMANSPSFDPNQYGRASFLNRAVGMAYEPGSTFKIITLASALEEGVISPEDFFFCENGSYVIQDRVIHDTGKHGWLSLEGIIQKSSNICAAKIGMMMNREHFYKRIKDFGFGSKTRLGLPAEAGGKIYLPEEWTPVKTATISYGHAISVSPMQMTAAINTVANGGIYVEPRVIGQLVSAGGHVVKSPEQESKRLIKKETAELLTRFMVAVTKPEGTASMARIAGLEIAGKTGTSRKFDQDTGQYSSSQHISSFIGFFPAQKPWVTLYVMVDEPIRYYGGARSAVPVFREIAKKIKGFAPDTSAPKVNPLTALSGVRPIKLDKAPVLLDNKGVGPMRHLLIGKSLREALALAGREGVALRVQGSGLVRDLYQDPQNPKGIIAKLR